LAQNAAGRPCKIATAEGPMWMEPGEFILKRGTGRQDQSRPTSGVAASLIRLPARGAGGSRDLRRKPPRFFVFLSVMQRFVSLFFLAGQFQVLALVKAAQVVELGRDIEAEREKADAVHLGRAYGPGPTNTWHCMDGDGIAPASSNRGDVYLPSFSPTG